MNAREKERKEDQRMIKTRKAIRRLIMKEVDGFLNAPGWKDITRSSIGKPKIELLADFVWYVVDGHDYLKGKVEERLVHVNEIM